MVRIWKESGHSLPEETGHRFCPDEPSLHHLSHPQGQRGGGSRCGVGVRAPILLDITESLQWTGVIVYGVGIEVEGCPGR